MGTAVYFFLFKVYLNSVLQHNHSYSLAIIPADGFIKQFRALKLKNYCLSAVLTAHFSLDFHHPIPVHLHYL
jgi:hypothetical protein